MKYELKNGRTLNIPDAEIEKSMKFLELTKEEAIQMWLEDNDYEVNEEQAELDEKARKVKIQHGAKADAPRKKTSAPRKAKVSDEKAMLFASILENLTRCESVEKDNITVLKDNKLIEVKIGDKVFKVDLIEQRKK